MPSDASTLTEQAEALLDVAYNAMSATVGGPPALKYISPGLPALDYQCDQVAVWAAGIGDEQAGALSPQPVVGQRRRLAWVNLCTLNVLMGRCIHTGKSTSKGYTPPLESELGEDGGKVMEDAWALWNAVSTAIVQDDLFGGVCQDIKLLSMTPLTPQGGVAGWVLTLSFQLPGYR